MRVLLLAANPDWTERLELGVEVRALRRCLASSKFRDQIELYDRHAATPKDLIDYVRELHPEVVHFSGHGEARGISLCDDNHNPVDVAGEDLKVFFRDRGIKLVVLNACHSEHQAAAIAEVVNCVVGTTEAVSDEIAARFTEAFYRALGDGVTIRQALRDAAETLKLGGHDVPYACHGNAELALTRPTDEFSFRDLFDVGSIWRMWHSEAPKALVFGVAGFFGNLVLTWLVAAVTEQPWQAVWFLGMIVLVTYVLWRLTVPGDGPLPRRFWAFFTTFVVFFSLAAGTNVLDFKRSLIGIDEPGDWLGLVRLGDWRYAVARHVDPVAGMALITLSDDETATERRANIRNAIAFASANGARAIGLDFHFSVANEFFDASICDLVTQSREEGRPVIGAYDFEVTQGGDIVPRRTVETLSPCFPPEHQGHAVAYLESDDRIRGIPTRFKGEVNRESFSYRIADAIDPTVDERSYPELLFVLPPRTPFQVFDVSDLRQDDDAIATAISDKIVIIGGGRLDTFDTPFVSERISGALIHAYAVHSYLTDTYIARVGSSYSYLLAFGGCLILFMAAAAATSASRLIVLAAVLHCIALLIAAAAMVFGSVWLPVIYPVAAFWLSVVLLNVPGVRQRFLSRNTVVDEVTAAV